MRNLDNTLDGNLDDNISAYTTGSVASLLTTSSINENQTAYNLLPVVINQPPIISRAIADASSPQIKASQTADASGRYLYQFPDGTIKVLIGATFDIKIQAVQPNILNVENGIPIIKEANQDLFYTWKLDDGILRSFEQTSLRSKVRVVDNVIRFEKIQPISAGTYTCEISNDIGVVISEPITIEVLNPNLDTFFYKNLIVNGSGIEGIGGWEGDTDTLVVREMTKRNNVLLKTPNRIDVFGYNADTMHPRPYQLETGVIKDVNYMQDFSSNGKGGYFSRDVYKFEQAGGKYYVNAYQDIDVTPIQDLVKGSVYGVEGVRAILGCYIGNAIGQFVPTKSTLTPDQKTDPKNYAMGHPRISVENFLTAGPGFVVDKCYVTLEEYDKETRLISRVLLPNGTVNQQTSVITLLDPWTKTLSKHYGKKYYENDKFQLGITSNAQGLDAVLFAADELYPKIEDRPTHGQYMEFNRLVLERLNPKTTKIRVGINFFTNDSRIANNYDYVEFNSDVIFENIGYEKNYKKNTFEQKGNVDEVDFILSSIDRIEKFKGKPRTQQVPLAPPPRVAVTGITLSLLPIERGNKGTTDYYTQSAFNLNNRPQVSTSSGLKSGVRFDPQGVLFRDLFVYFTHKSQPKVTFEDTDFYSQHQTTLSLKQQSSTEASPKKFNVVEGSIFPFKLDGEVRAYGLSALDFEPRSQELDLLLTPYRDNIYTHPTGSTRSGVENLVFANIKLAIKDAATTIHSELQIVPTAEENKDVIWKQRFRYTLSYMVRKSGSDFTDTSFTNQYFLLVDFNSETPVVLYKDSSIGGIEASFIVDRYQIDDVVGLQFELPQSLLTTPIGEGGLGIPLIEGYEEQGVGGIKALSFLSNLVKFPSLFPSASASQTITSLYNSYRVVAQEFNKRIAQQNTQAAVAVLGLPPEEGLTIVEQSQFETDIRGYLSNSVTLGYLKLEYLIGNLSATIYTGLTVLDPMYTTTLYAIGMAPQVGTNLNGSPIQGMSESGITYTLKYPQIVDSQTEL